MLRYSYFIEGQFIDSTLADLEITHANKRPSFHFFCETCGRIWAEVTVEDGTLSHHLALNGECRKCGSGSIYEAMWPAYRDDLEWLHLMPKKVLALEFLNLFNRRCYG